VPVSLASWIGVVAAVLTTVSFLPQALKAIRARDTRAISLGMYALFTAGVALWLVYGILIGSAPVAVSNGITLVLSGVILAMKIRFG
jgi:MtN3 and saliva related transmembrane protein